MAEWIHAWTAHAKIKINLKYCFYYCELLKTELLIR